MTIRYGKVALVTLLVHLTVNQKYVQRITKLNRFIVTKFTLMN